MANSGEIAGRCEYCGTIYDGELIIDELNGTIECPECKKASNNWGIKQNQKDYCSIGRNRCSCGWTGFYPVSGCPECNKSFVD